MSNVKCRMSKVRSATLGDACVAERSKKGQMSKVNVVFSLSTIIYYLSTIIFSLLTFI